MVNQIAEVPPPAPVKVLSPSLSTFFQTRPYCAFCAIKGSIPDQRRCEVAADSPSLLHNNSPVLSLSLPFFVLFFSVSLSFPFFDASALVSRLVTSPQEEIQGSERMGMIWYRISRGTRGRISPLFPTIKTQLSTTHATKQSIIQWL